MLKKSAKIRVTLLESRQNSRSHIAWELIFDFVMETVLPMGNGGLGLKFGANPWRADTDRELLVKVLELMGHTFDP